MDIPVYIVNGFLESGKTTFIQETMSDPDFSNGVKTLLIVCEEGECEYDEVALSKIHVDIVSVEDMEELSAEFLKRCADFYKPQRVMIEYNGMWKVQDLIERGFPKGWILVQIITIIDASTYQTYLNNMKSIMIEQFRESDTIIFNRCDDTTDKIALRRSVKPVNRKGAIIYESADGATDDAGEEILPFDINADIIEICDDDYGIWYMDAMDNPKKYDGKTVKFLGMTYKSPKLPKGSFVPGRFAMTCCANDIAFMGFICKSGKENANQDVFESLKNREYVMVTAKIKCEFYKEYRGKGPVLYAIEMTKAPEPKDNLVYFN